MKIGRMAAWLLVFFLVGACQKKKGAPLVGGLGKPLTLASARDLRLTPDARWATYLIDVEKPRLSGLPPDMVIGSLFVAGIGGEAPRKIAEGVTNMPGGQLFTADSKWVLALAGFNAANQSGELLAFSLEKDSAARILLGKGVSYFLGRPDSSQVAFVEKGVLKLFDFGKGQSTDVAAQVSTAEFSPDSRWLFYKRRGVAASGLWVQGRAGDPLKLADQVGDYSVSPDSTRVAFQKRSETGDGTFDLFLAEAPDFNPRLVSEATSRFAFSKDGKWLIRTQGAKLQAGADALNFMGDLFVGPSHGRQARKLGERVESFTLSPDSQQVAFLDRYNLDLREGRLVVAPLLSGEAVPLAKKVKTVLWSPDGKRLAFQSVFFTDFGPTPELMLYTMGEEKPVKLLPWVFGFGFDSTNQYLLARGNCSRVGPTGMPRACDLLVQDLSARPLAQANKVVEGVYSFKLSDSGGRLLITYARMDSDTYDVAAYDFKTKVLKTLDPKAALPAYFIGKNGEQAVYVVAEAGRAGVYVADVDRAVAPPTAQSP